MAKQTIGIGTLANDGTGDPLRTAFDKVNDNFTEVYDAISNKGTDVFVVNAADNSIDGSVGVCFIAGGRAEDPNIIGSTGKPVRNDLTPTGWSNDTAYVSGSASVATIGGGYDHVNNQSAGTICGGGHNFIKYNADGHSTIVGGSYNIIAGARSFIGGGRGNAIDSSTAFGVVVGGDDNELLNGDDGFIGGGRLNEISSSNCVVAGGRNNRVSGQYGVIVGGDDNQVSGLYGGIASGLSNVVSGNYSFVHGRSNTVSASDSAAFGHTNTVSHASSLAFGKDAQSRAEGTLTFSPGKVVELGDAQSSSWCTRVRTTNATVTNVSPTMAMPAGKIVAGTFKVMLIAMRDGSADANNDANYAQSSYQLEGGFHWDGTNGLFYDASGTTALGTSPTRNLTAIRDNITIATPPQLRLSAGSLRVAVTGIASTTINWVIRFDLVTTLVS